MGDEFKDNSEEYKELLAQAIRRGLRTIGMRAETHAKENCPVDTGYASNSITFALSGESANISEYEADRGKNNDKSQQIRVGGIPKPFEFFSHCGTSATSSSCHGRRGRGA